MAELGIASYRFSVAWPRVMPDGRTVNQAGLDFYRRLVDGLLERGIRPLMTLYHWDLPQSLDVGDAGGWLVAGRADRFADFAVLLGKELGDRVPAITTLNEPWCSAFLGYASGEHAPGVTDDAPRPPGRPPPQPRARPGGHGAARRPPGGRRPLRGAEPAPGAGRLPTAPRTLAAAEHVDLIANRIFLDPMFAGGYSDELRASTAGPDRLVLRAEPVTRPRSSVPLDSLGVNFYNPSRVRGGVGGGAGRSPARDRAFFADIPGPRTVMGWPIVPSGLTDLLVRVQRDVGLPIQVTENGLGGARRGRVDGAVHDHDRIDYLHDHLAAVLDARSRGADVRGYFVWTLLDNFEWAWGYDKRFGLVHVDFADQRRTLKDSAHWYADVIARNAL